MTHSSRYPLFSGIGLLVIGILLLAVIALGNAVLQGTRLDLTQNKVFTLSPGTRNILGKIDEPINLYFFLSKETVRGYPQISVYARRVRDMLTEISEKADGKLKLHVIDPEPFSDDEDRAVELGLQGVPIGSGGEVLYFGLAGSNAVDQTAAIPFFTIERQNLLEYDLSKLIYQLSRDKKAVVGMLSTIEILGGLDRETRQLRQGTVLGQQLRQLFEVRELKPDIRAIPDDIQMLVLIHPQKLPDAAVYAIDQFVLRGGKALIFVDPFSAVQGKAGTPDKPELPSSNVEKLLHAWGVKLAKEQVVLDSEHAIRVTADPSRPPVFHFAMLSLGKDVLNQDDVTTRGLETLNVGFAGFLERLPESKIAFTPLLTTGPKSMEYSAYAVDPNMDPGQLVNGFRPSNKKHVIGARLSGAVETAFPGGLPAAPEEPEPAPDDPLAALNDLVSDKDKKDDSAQAPQIKQSKEPINVIVVADTDILADRIWVEIQDFFGKKVATPWASNGDFVISAVDNLLGSSDVISIRSRAGYSRPFDRVEALKRTADAKFRATEQHLQERLRATETQLNQFQAQKTEGGGTLLTPEQRETLTKFREDKLEIRKQLRDVRRELDEDIEQLGTWLKFINIGLVPILLILSVLGFFIIRTTRKPAAGGAA